MCAPGQKGQPRLSPAPGISYGSLAPQGLSPCVEKHAEVWPHLDGKPVGPRTWGSAVPQAQSLQPLHLGHVSLSLLRFCRATHVRLGL